MGEVRIVRDGGPSPIVAGGADTNGRFDFLVSTYPYLAGPPLHVHDEQDDTFFVLEGILTIQVGDELIDLGPGDFATVPPGIAHTFANAKPDQGPVRAVNVMTPGGFDGYFREAFASGGPPDPSIMNDLGRKYGVTWVGPTIAARLGLN